METLSFRKNYLVHCDRHHSLMMSMSINLPQSESTQRCCIEEGCTRQYEVLAGYYDWVDGEEISAAADSRTCRQDKLRMYLAMYNKETKREEWRCPACQQTEVVYL